MLLPSLATVALRLRSCASIPGLFPVVVRTELHPWRAGMSGTSLSNVIRKVLLPVALNRIVSELRLAILGPAPLVQLCMRVTFLTLFANPAAVESNIVRARVRSLPLRSVSVSVGLTDLQMPQARPELPFILPAFGPVGRS